MRNKFLFILFACVFCYKSFSQELELVDSVIAINPDIFTIDQKGDLFLTDIKGNIYQYSNDLKLIRNYSPSKPFRINQLDVRPGLRIFCFYRDIQEFILLDRFLVATENYQFDLPNTGFISHATLAFDNNLWLIDQPSMKLIKYNVNQRRVEFDVPLNVIIPISLVNVVAFREYQNQILIADEKNGIFIFDNLGNYSGKRNITIGQEINFHSTYLYYLNEGQIIKKDLYHEKEEIIQLPDNIRVDKVLLFRDYVFVLVGKIIFKYQQK